MPALPITTQICEQFPLIVTWTIYSCVKSGSHFLSPYFHKILKVFYNSNIDNYDVPVIFWKEGIDVSKNYFTQKRNKVLSSQQYFLIFTTVNVI